MQITHHKNKKNEDAVTYETPATSRVKRGDIGYTSWYPAAEQAPAVVPDPTTIVHIGQPRVRAKSVSQESVAPSTVKHPPVQKKPITHRQEKMVSQLDTGVIMHEIASLTADMNNTRTFHFDPDVPHVVHDRNIHEKNYKEIEFAPILEGEESDVVVTHSEPTSKLSYLESTNPHKNYTGPQSVTELNLIFGDDVPGIVQAILDGSVDFSNIEVEFSNPALSVVEGEDGFAPATEETPFVLRTHRFKAVSYLLNTMMIEFTKMGLPTDKLIEVLTEMLENSTGVGEWLNQIILLWVEVKR